MQTGVKIEWIGPRLERSIQHAIDRFQRFRLINASLQSRSKKWHAVFGKSRAPRRYGGKIFHASRCPLTIVFPRKPRVRLGCMQAKRYD